jgi:uncharacterized protein
MATVLITGGTGLIGKALTALLTGKGYEVVILTRNTTGKKIIPQVRYAAWDIKAQTIDVQAVVQSDYIVHLAGANVGDKRWTAKRKKEIVDSRTQSSALIIKTLRENKHRVKAMVSPSGIGWYGPDGAGKKSFVETDPPADDFLGETCRLWEAGVDPVTGLGIRLIKFRTGIVLGNEGGALKEFKRPLKFGVATILGSGRQVVSWLHLEDVCRIYLYGLENEQMSGVYNAVTAAPVTNKELILQLANMMRAKFYLPVHVPSFVLKIVLGEMSIEILKSTTVSNAKLQKAGFVFLYPSLQAALEQLVKK